MSGGTMEQASEQFSTASGDTVREDGVCVDLRIVLLTVANGQLLVAVLPGAGRWRLPRGIPFAGVPLDSAARSLIRESTELHEQYLEQLYTLSVRDADRWIIVVSYLALIATPGGLPEPMAEWQQVDTVSLSEADTMVLEYAIVRLRAKLGYTTIAYHLMPETFTLSELQASYESVTGLSLDKRNFRRRVIASGMLEPLPEKRRDGSHRPAQLYRFRADHDPAAFLTPSWAGDA
jgi:8-oxo-dGTP diphosphatase